MGGRALKKGMEEQAFLEAIQEAKAERSWEQIVEARVASRGRSLWRGKVVFMIEVEPGIPTEVLRKQLREALATVGKLHKVSIYGLIEH